MQGIAQACCRVIILSANAWTKKVTIKIILVTLQCNADHVFGGFYPHVIYYPPSMCSL